MEERYDPSRWDELGQHELEQMIMVVHFARNDNHFAEFLFEIFLYEMAAGVPATKTSVNIPFEQLVLATKIAVATLTTYDDTNDVSYGMYVSTAPYSLEAEGAYKYLKDEWRAKRLFMKDINMNHGERSSTGKIPKTFSVPRLDPADHSHFQRQYAKIRPEFQDRYATIVDACREYVWCHQGSGGGSVMLGELLGVEKYTGAFNKKLLRQWESSSGRDSSSAATAGTSNGRAAATSDSPQPSSTHGNDSTAKSKSASKKAKKKKASSAASQRAMAADPVAPSRATESSSPASSSLSWLPTADPTPFSDDSDESELDLDEAIRVLQDKSGYDTAESLFEMALLLEQWKDRHTLIMKTAMNRFNASELKRRDMIERARQRAIAARKEREAREAAVQAREAAVQAKEAALRATLKQLCQQGLEFNTSQNKIRKGVERAMRLIKTKAGEEAKKREKDGKKAAKPRSREEKMTKGNQAVGAAEGSSSKKTTVDGSQGDRVQTNGSNSKKQSPSTASSSSTSSSTKGAKSNGNPYGLPEPLVREEDLMRILSKIQELNFFVDECVRVLVPEDHPNATLVMAKLWMQVNRAILNQWQNPNLPLLPKLAEFLQRLVTAGVMPFDKSIELLTLVRDATLEERAKRPPLGGSEDTRKHIHELANKMDEEEEGSGADDDNNDLPDFESVTDEEEEKDRANDSEVMTDEDLPDFESETDDDDDLPGFESATDDDLPDFESATDDDLPDFESATDEDDLPDFESETDEDQLDYKKTERLAKEKADRLAKEKADRLAKEKADRLARLEADRLAKLKADRLARLEADRLAKVEAARLAKLKEEADRRAKQKVAQLAKQEAARNDITAFAAAAAKAEAERIAQRKAQDEAIVRAKSHAINTNYSGPLTHRIAQREAQAEAVVRDNAHVANVNYEESLARGRQFLQEILEHNTQTEFRIASRVAVWEKRKQLKIQAGIEKYEVDRAQEILAAEKEAVEARQRSEAWEKGDEFGHEFERETAERKVIEQRAKDFKTDRYMAIEEMRREDKANAAGAPGSAVATVASSTSQVDEEKKDQQQDLTILAMLESKLQEARESVEFLELVVELHKAERQKVEEKMKAQKAAQELEEAEKSRGDPARQPKNGAVFFNWRGINFGLSLWKQPTEHYQTMEITLNEWYHELLPSESSMNQREEFLLRLQGIFDSQFLDKGLQLRPFGSYITGLGNDWSDIDICIYSEDFQPFASHSDVVYLAEFLRSKNMENVVAITDAKVPIIKFIDPISKTACDMNVQHPLGIYNSQLIKAYLEIDPRLSKFIYLLKYFAKSHGILDGSSGFLCSYAYILMAIVFFQEQKQAILPRLQVKGERPRMAKANNKSRKQRQNGMLYPTFAQCQTEGTVQTLHVYQDNKVFDCSFDTRVELYASYGQANKKTVAQLLFEFFEYFSRKFDYRTMEVSTAQGKVQERLSLSKEKKQQLALEKLSTPSAAVEVVKTKVGLMNPYVYNSKRDIWLSAAEEAYLQDLDANGGYPSGTVPMPGGESAAAGEGGGASSSSSPSPSPATVNATAAATATTTTTATTTATTTRYHDRFGSEPFLCVMDPFVANRNVAGTCRGERLVKVWKCFDHAYQCLAKGDFDGAFVPLT